MLQAQQSSEACTGTVQRCQTTAASCTCPADDFFHRATWASCSCTCVRFERTSRRHFAYEVTLCVFASRSGAVQTHARSVFTSPCTGGFDCLHHAPHGVAASSMFFTSLAQTLASCPAYAFSQASRWEGIFYELPGPFVNASSRWLFLHAIQSTCLEHGSAVTHKGRSLRSGCSGHARRPPFLRRAAHCLRAAMAVGAASNANTAVMMAALSGG